MKIVLSLLCWNTRDITLESVAALAAETDRLRRLGAEPLIAISDNGSTDGTQEALRAAAADLALPHRLLLSDVNRGISRARNEVIDLTLETGADYLLLMDGDVEVVPGSIAAMVEHLEAAESEVGCLAADSDSHTTDRAATTPYLATLAACRITDDRDELWAARTGYVVFRRAVFAAGVRFDENPPFDRPGWGCEDVDLAFQIHAKGFYIQIFAGMTFLHRAVSSSIPMLRESGFDPRADYDRRRRYVVEKWQGSGLGEMTLEFLRGPRAEARF